MAIQMILQPEVCSAFQSYKPYLARLNEVMLFLNRSRDGSTSAKATIIMINLTGPAYSPMYCREENLGPQAAADISVLSWL